MSQPLRMTSLVAKHNAIHVRKNHSWSQGGFSVVELIVVILLISILAVFMAPKFQQSDQFDIRQVSDRILSYARFAQQLAMNNTLSNVRFILESSCSIAQSNGAKPPCFYVQMQADYDQDFVLDTIQLPNNLDEPYYVEANSVTSFPTQTISYDRLGNINSASALVLKIQGAMTISLCLEPSGFIHSGACY